MSLRNKHTFVIEAINSVDASAFVVTTEDEKVFGIFDFVGEEETYGFERLLATVYIITEEQIVCFGRESAVFKESEKVIILSVNVTWG